MTESQAAPDLPKFVLTTDGEFYGSDTPENCELVRRIHACFIACEGISTEELEQGVVAEMRRVIGQVVPLLSASSNRSEAA